MPRFRGQGGYVRRYPKEFHSKPMDLWRPDAREQAYDSMKDVYGPVDQNPFNVPIPMRDHFQAVTSSGSVMRLPTPGTAHKMWNDNELQDGMVMFRPSDETLTGTMTSAATFPQQLSGIFWTPYNSVDQLGNGRV